MSGLELKARGGRLVHVRPTGRIDEEDLPAWTPPERLQRPTFMKRIATQIRKLRES